MSDSNRGQLTYVEETTWGVKPAATAFTELRIKSDSLKHGITNTESEEVRSDRQTDDLIQTGAEATGGYEFELSYESPPDALLEGALFTDWPASVISQTFTDVTIVASTKTLGSALIDLTSLSLSVGQWIELTGFDTAATEGYFRITSLAADAIVLEDVDGNLADQSAGAGTIKGNMIRNGTTEHSYSLQRELADKAEFFLYRGMMVNTFSWTVTANAIVMGSIDFMGADIATTDLKQVTHGTGTDTAAPTNDVMSAVTNVGKVFEGASLSAIAADLFVQEISFVISNNLRGTPAVGTLGNADVGVGKFSVSGNLNAMFEDSTLYDKFLAGTETALSFKLEDSSGNAYIVTFPKIKFEDDDGGKIPGTDSDVVENISWKALRDSTTDCMMQIDKFAA